MFRGKVDQARRGIILVARQKCIRSRIDGHEEERESDAPGYTRAHQHRVEVDRPDSKFVM